MKQLFYNTFNIQVDELINDKKKRKTFICNIDYNNIDNLLIILHFFNINNNKINPDFFDNEQLMLLLVQKDPTNIKFMKNILNNFEEIAITAVSKNGMLINNIFHFFKNIDVKIQRKIILEAVKNDGWVLKYPLFGTNWLKDKEIVYTGVKHKDLSYNKDFYHPLQNTGDYLLNDYHLIKTALLYDINTFKIIGDKVKYKHDILEYVLGQDESYIYEVKESILLATDFIYFLIDKHLFGSFYRLFDIWKSEIIKGLKSFDELDTIYNFETLINLISNSIASTDDKWKIESATQSINLINDILLLENK